MSTAKRALWVCSLSAVLCPYKASSGAENVKAPWEEAGADPELHLCGKVLTVKTAQEIPTAVYINQSGSSSFPKDYFFFDIDETVLLPNTTFVYGLPATDRFLASLGTCEKAALPAVLPLMERAYYSSHEMLIDQDLPNVIRGLQERGHSISGLTSRCTEDAACAWHNEVVFESLDRFGVVFSDVHSNNSEWQRGVFFASDEDVRPTDAVQEVSGKAKVIDNETETGQRAVLVDNTLKKLQLALAQARTCTVGIHFTAVFEMQKSQSEMTQWFCEALESLQVECPMCQSSRSELDEPQRANLQRNDL
uniref:FCP1 homology domain-containing protein n=1 Tax=Chromera velia CCMP2878 TaxID=1169474 RepID=A0A0G4HR78_9ALVE|eukprot:Cvel_8054.t1-p1 / transcript=Cvel_8054.t1 / gene=Cvel_8054 / organism=Chromera_velia_CCMP2878 / gene_product=hypothetical protein / transcript_product=hypothetical protein / location=Cvel_scaffold436:771-1688(-) / protein_length=306 / sequence_SO=supercontig / SO=protein_coding / is_pseudo=false